MKKSTATCARLRTHKLSLRSETLRALTEQELTLVVAGNCLNASGVTQSSNANAAGVC